MNPGDPVGQKAPSAIRCIKTRLLEIELDPVISQKAPSAIRCIKTQPIRSVIVGFM